MSNRAEKKRLNSPIEAILETCQEITQLLIDKNSAYGNSAFEPVQIFSKACPREQVLVRIDDKLSRVASGSEFPGDDTILDLIGYLILLRAHDRLSK